MNDVDNDRYDLWYDATTVGADLVTSHKWAIRILVEEVGNVKVRPRAAH